MEVRLRVFAVLSTSVLLSFGLAQAQAPGTGWVTISGSDQGPIYPCGNTGCPTYDSGQVTITVNGFNAVTNYSHAPGQRTSAQLANSLATQLNSVASPVTAVKNNTKITLTSKLAGTNSKLHPSPPRPPSTVVSKTAFYTTPLAPTLTALRR